MFWREARAEFEYASLYYPVSTCLVSSYGNKADTFEVKQLFIRTPAKSGRATIYLDPSISVEDMTEAIINFILAQEFPVKFWYSLLPRVVSCVIVDIEGLIASLDGSSKGWDDFITPKNKLKVDEGITNLAFSFPVDVFKTSDSNKASFDSLWPQLRGRIINLSQSVVLLGSSFSSSAKSTSVDFSDAMVELRLFQNTMGGDEDITDVILRSC